MIHVFYVVRKESSPGLDKKWRCQKRRFLQ